jgi:hypothetical protein
MVVVLLGAITVAMAAAFMVVMGPDDDAAERLTASHDGQLLALYLPQDMQSASPTLADTAPTASLACAGAVAGTNVLRLGWTQPQPVTTTFAISYRVVRVGDDWQLIRFSCENGGAVERLTVAHDLASAAAAVAAIDGAVVSITVTESSGRQFTVSGTRRTPENECRVTNISLAYTVLAQGDPAGHLTDSVMTTVDLAGPCSGVPLDVVFTPTSSPVSLALGTSGTPRRVNIDKNTYTWSLGDKLFEIRRADGLPIQSPAATLVVTPYVEPCAVTNVGLDPATVALDASSHLDSDVVVTVDSTGQCGDLELVFQSTASGPARELPLGSAPPYGATISRASSYTWEAGTRAIRVRQVATSTELSSANLTVAPYVCVVQSIVASPNPVGHTGTGNGTRLAQDVVVTVTTTGPCSGIQLQYAPRDTDVTVALTGGPQVWTATIPGPTGSLRWDTGMHVLTVLIDGDPTSPTATLVVN